MQDSPFVSPSLSSTFQAPLSNVGVGPGMILLVDRCSDLVDASTHSLDPPPLQKWAEEGYAVVQVHVSTDQKNSLADFQDALEFLDEHESCTSTQGYGLISYLADESGSQILQSVSSSTAITAVVSYGGESVVIPSKPHLLHIAGSRKVVATDISAKSYTYPTVNGLFVLPSSKSYNSSAAAVSHTRSLTFLKPLLGGPYFDLEAIWEEHTRYEFEDRAVECTMATMVQEPYVNHIPTLTGGVGRAKLTDFYRGHFIFNNPDDTELELVSRTIGIDRVIDEFILSFTHDKMIDWLLPGVPPTGQKARIPFTGVVNIRGDKLYHEHIWWDQATVLMQLGLLPEYLPFPYPVDGQGLQANSNLEYRLPVTGADQALKLVDESSVPSNEMFDFKVRVVSSV